MEEDDPRLFFFFGREEEDACGHEGSKEFCRIFPARLFFFFAAESSVPHWQPLLHMQAQESEAKHSDRPADRQTKIDREVDR